MFLKIIFVLVGWLIAGAIINLLVYGGRPRNEWGTSEYARGWHWVINIIAILMFISTLVN